MYAPKYGHNTVPVQHGLEILPTERKPFHQERGLHILGGLSIGEPPERRFKVTEETTLSE